MKDYHRKRVLIVAFCCDPQGTMEERNGWHRALIAAQEFDVTVFYSPKSPPVDLAASVPEQLKPHLHFVPVILTGVLGWMIQREAFFYFAYRNWHRKVYLAAKEIHASRRFDLTHLATLCGFREPGYVWKLGVPNIWGPIGGSHHFPFQMLRIVDWQSKLRELVRTCINYWQLHHSPRIRQAATKSIVLAATKNSAKELQQGLRISTQVDLETGIDYQVSPLRELRDSGQPFRILWAGRLRAWKGLPLLLHALARLHPSINYQVRILGDGSCKESWQQLAEQLGVDDRIEWLSWPTYRETLSHYEWANAFAFTSQRDTSGTGLVESLAAGCPLIAVNHQGVADLLEHDCGLAVDVASFELAVNDFAKAIEQFTNDSELWLQKSHAATQYAHQLHWSNRSEWMLEVYGAALEPTKKQVPQADKIALPSVALATHSTATHSTATVSTATVSTTTHSTTTHSTATDGPATVSTATDHPKLKSLLALMDQGVVSFTNFMTILLLARNCDDAVFAAVALAAQFINYSRSALERLLSTSYAALIHRTDEKESLTGSSLYHASLFTGLVTGVAVCVAMMFWGLAESKTLAFGLLTQCMLLPCQMLRDHFRSMSLSRLKVGFVLTLDIVASVVQLGLIAGLIFKGQTDSLSMSVVWAFANLLFLSIWFLRPPMRFQVQRHRLGNDWRDSWDYSKWLVMGRCLGIASYLFVPWILTALKGDQEWNLFAKAINLVGLSVLFVTGLNNFFLPLTIKSFHRDGMVAMKKVLKQSLWTYMAILAGLCVLYASIGNPLMQVIYKTTDPRQGWLLTLLGLNVLTFSIAIVATNGLAALKLSLATFWGEFANFCASAMIAIPLIFWLGSLGAAVSILLGSLAATIVTLIVFSRELKKCSRV